MEQDIHEYPEFSGKNVPVKEVARLMGKDQQFIRQGIKFYFIKNKII